MKTRLPGLICMLLILVLSIAAARWNLSESAAFVRQNEETLTAMAELAMTNNASGNFSCPGAEYLRSALYSKDGTHELPYVEFFKETDTGLSGFYYSPTDIPIPFGGVNLELNTTASGWTWGVEGVHGTTSKITDKWYTFQVWM